MEFSRSWHLPGCDSGARQALRWIALSGRVEVVEGLPLKALKGWRPVRTGASG